CPDPNQRNKWNIIDDIAKSPSLGTADFTTHASKFLAEAWMDLKRRGCRFNFQIVAGSCQRPDQFDQWDAKVIFLGGRLTNLSLTAINPLSGDDNAPIDWTGSLSFRDWDVIR